MKRMTNIATVTVICILVGLPLMLYTAAWYHRWKAERLLAAVKGLHVGVTTQADYEAAIHRFVDDGDRIREGEPGQPVPGAYGIGTLPEWMVRPIFRLPEPLRAAFDRWSIIEGTRFTVYPTFKDGMLIAIRIAEEQGSGHPFGGFVTIHAGKVQYLFPWYTEVFSGYSGRPMGVDDRVIYTRVDMDDRATPEQRRRALDFRFSCFTAFRPCSDGRQMLDPVTTDN